MERKTSTVLLMMLSVLVIFALLVGVAFVLATDYKATVYEYEVSGTHEYINQYGDEVKTTLSGTVSTTHMFVFDMEKVTTVSDVHYFVGDSKKEYDLTGKWSFFSEPEIGEFSYELVDFLTPGHGMISVNVHIHETDNETVTRYIGQDDGIVYKVERTIITQSENGKNLKTEIIQYLVSYEDTMMPIKL